MQSNVRNYYGRLYKANSESREQTKLEGQKQGRAAKNQDGGIQSADRSAASAVHSSTHLQCLSKSRYRNLLHTCIHVHNTVVYCQSGLLLPMIFLSKRFGCSMCACTKINMCRFVNCEPEMSCSVHAQKIHYVMH